MKKILLLSAMSAVSLMSITSCGKKQSQSGSDANSCVALPKAANGRWTCVKENDASVVLLSVCGGKSTPEWIFTMKPHAYSHHASLLQDDKQKVLKRETTTGGERLQLTDTSDASLKFQLVFNYEEAADDSTIDVGIEGKPAETFACERNLN